MSVEGPPISMEERVAIHRLSQLPKAMEHIAIGEKVIAEFGAKGTKLNREQEDGSKETILFDAQVLQAMKGGAFGMWTELVQAGYKEEADAIVKKEH